MPSTARRFQGPWAAGPASKPRERSVRPRAPDAAVSAVIGTLMLTVITVVMAMGFAQFLSDAQPTPMRTVHLDLGAALDPGTSQWGTGDEQVRLFHRGGQDLHRDLTRVIVEVGGATYSYEDGALDDGFSDGVLQLGEWWAADLTVAPDTTVSIEVVTKGEPRHVLASLSLRSGPQDCTGETLPPVVVGWSQDPEDVTTGHTGAVTVTVTLADGCAGVDTTVDPHLWYRLNDGSDPGYTDAGAMTHLGGTSWRGDIPEPASGWSAHEGEVLEYHLDPLTDLLGNTGTSVERTDTVRADDPGAGTLTYTTGHMVFSGAVTDFPHAQDGEDGGLTANLTEAATGSGTVTSEIHGTAHTSSGATSPADATGSPDDTHATLPSDRDWVGVSGFNTFNGGISKVELAFEGHYDGTATDTEDELTLSYEVGGSAGATSQSFPLSQLGEGADGPAEYVDVTGDRAWTWNDVGNAKVQAEYTKQQSEDAVDFHVDALWLRVTYDDPAYNLSVRFNVTGIPTGSTQDLELRYNTTGEPFHVQVWDHTQATWTTRGDALVETTPVDWTYRLTADEISSGEVRVRILDDGADAGTQDTLYLDHLRVRTT